MNNFRNITFANLHDPLRYEVEIEKIFNRIKEKKGIGALFDGCFEGVSYFSFGYKRKELANILATLVRKEQYTLSPPVLQSRATKNKQKKRLLYQMNPMDKIVVAVLAKLLSELLLPFLNSAVFSYRAGKSPTHEVRALCSYIQQKRREGHSKGIYLMQTDIASYSDQIFLGDSSPFWTKLAEYFVICGAEPSPYHWSLIKEAIRPTYTNLEGDSTVNIKGAPTGSPITTILYNYYVACVDFYMTEEPTLFYARYSDDIIFCHPNSEIIDSYEDYLHLYLKTLSLQLSEKKTHRYFLSPSGFYQKDNRWQGTNKTNLLGFLVDAKGTYALSSKRQTSLLQNIRSRLVNSLEILKEESIEEQGKALCHIVNQFLSLEERPNSYTLSAIYKSSDLTALERLDFLIALMIAELLSGIRGVKAFRKISYHTIREDFGLSSLLWKRNSRQKRSFALEMS